MDKGIKNDVEQALSPLLPEGLAVRVDKGVVVLEGSVSADWKALEAERFAWQVPGVKQVVNNLEVVPPIISLDSLRPEPESIAGVENTLDAVEDGEPYFPPTDPVVWPSETSDQDIEIRNGFAPDSTEEAFFPQTDSELLHGDEQITEEAQKALKLDAATADLNVEVETVDGVVRLHGRVHTLDDVENAEAVAARVPGVVEVVEELEVE